MNRTQGQGYNEFDKDSSSPSSSKSSGGTTSRRDPGKVSGRSGFPKIKLNLGGSSSGSSAPLESNDSVSPFDGSSRNAAKAQKRTEHSQMPTEYLNVPRIELNADTPSSGSSAVPHLSDQGNPFSNPFDTPDPSVRSGASFTGSDGHRQPLLHPKESRSVLSRGLNEQKVWRQEYLTGEINKRSTAKETIKNIKKDSQGKLSESDKELIQEHQNIIFMATANKRKTKAELREINKDLKKEQMKKESHCSQQ